MKIQVFRIDNNGFLIEPIVVDDTEPIPIDCIALIPPDGLFKAQLVNGNWVEGEDPNIILSIAKKAKVSSLDDSCNKTILGNFPVIIGDTLYYFPNDDTAQKNFDKFLLAFSSGLANEPENFTCYDENGKVCRVAFDAKSYISLYKAHLIHIASNIALFRDYLEPTVDNCASVDEVNAINWLTLLFGQTQVSINDSSEMIVALSLEGTLSSEVTATADLS